MDLFSNNLLLYLLFCYGATALLMYAKVFQWLRNIVERVAILKELWQCPMCLGFWVGLIVYLLTAPFITAYMFIVHAGIFAVTSSGVTWALCSITQFALWVKAYFEDCVMSKYKEKTKERELNE